MADPFYHFMTIIIIKWIFMNTVSGYDFLVAVPAESGGTHPTIYFQAGESGGRVQVHHPGQSGDGHLLLNNGRHIELIDAKLGVTSGVENNKSIVVTCSDKNTQVTVYENNFEKNIFYPLPVSKLGTRYLVSTCHYDGDTSVLIVASHSQKTDVNITRYQEPDQNGGTFRKSETTYLRLNEYQTYTMREESDLSGTLIVSSGTVAVFSGTIHKGTGLSYTQMHPVQQLGDEYVVSVDDTAQYQLRITTDSPNTRITFNNGPEANVTTVLRKNLTQNEDLYFISSSTVMATICGVGEDISITHVPPVSEYGTYGTRYPIHPGGKVMKFISEDVDVQSLEEDAAWKNIAGTRFWVGTKLDNDTMLNVVFTGLAMVFGEHTTYYLPPQDYENTGLQPGTEGESYLVAPLPSYPYITALTDSTSGSWKVTYPDVGSNNPDDDRSKPEVDRRKPEVDRTNVRKLPPASRDVFVVNPNFETGKELKKKALVVQVDNNTQIRVTNFVNMFSPLPASVLGTTYVINCQDSGEMLEVLVIANHDHKTEVDMTFGFETYVAHDGREYKYGDKLRVNFDEYDTLSIESPTFCGTRIESSKPIAVFLEAKPSSSTSLYPVGSYEQILPVKLNGQEYVVSVDDPNTYNVDATYSLHIYSESSTALKFSDEKEAVNFSNHYVKQIAPNAAVYFTTTSPVPASLCRRVKRHNETFGSCMLLPPTTLYRSETILPINIPIPSSFKILCKRYSSVGVIAQTGSNLKQQLPVTWDDIQGSEFTVGTFRFVPSVEEFSSNTFLRFMSDQRFAVLGFDQYSIFHSGYDVIKGRQMPEISGKENSSQINLALAIGVSCGVIVLLLGLVLAISICKWRRRRGRVNRYLSEEDKLKSNNTPSGIAHSRRRNKPANQGPIRRSNFNMVDGLIGSIKVSETYI